MSGRSSESEAPSLKRYYSASGGSIFIIQYSLPACPGWVIGAQIESPAVQVVFDGNIAGSQFFVADSRFFPTTNSILAPMAEEAL